MSWFAEKKLWRIPWFVIILAVIFFSFASMIKEDKVDLKEQIIQPIKETTTPEVEKIIEELETIKSSSPADWSKKITILLDVPFVTQAPLGEWSDSKQQDGCEETAVLMAMAWVKGEKLSPQSAKKDIVAMADWQTKNYGNFVDTNAQDTADRLIKGYFKYDKVKVVEFKKVDQITEALKSGQLVLVPTNGRKLKNPNYKQPGPLTHMLVVRGYDGVSDEFITNDSGTRKGELYRYPTVRIFEAAQDYPTGDHEPIVNNNKSLIIVSK
jgi:hypothetical protein